MEDLFTKLLELPSLEVTLTEIGDKKIVLHCSSILGESYCPLCLQKSSFVKDKYTREIRDLSISGKEVYLRLTVRQFVCKECNRHFHEPFDFVGKSQTMTHRYEKFIYYRCKGVDLQYVVVQEDIRWATVHHIFTKYSKKQVKQRDGYSRAKRIGIDEIALKKGHKDYVAVIVDLETGSVLDLLADRGKAYLKGYFEQKGEAFCGQIECFCSDMWEGYLTCAKEVFPNAVIIADRFHFFTYLQKEVDKCRRYLRRKFPDGDSLKNSKWALFKPLENLSEQDAQKLDKVFQDPGFELLKRTWEARNEFRAILETHCSRQLAEAKIEEWKQKHTRIANRFLQKFIDFYDTWADYILNYFVYRHTTSLIEGINNKLKVIKRRAYGFLNFESFRLRAIIEFD